jgi:hypothetical protein
MYNERKIEHILVIEMNINDHSSETTKVKKTKFTGIVHN